MNTLPAADRDAPDRGGHSYEVSSGSRADAGGAE